MKVLILRGIFRRRFLHKTIRPAVLRTVSVVVALQLATTQVFANEGTNVWQGSDGNWSDGGNWLNQSPPGSVDTAEINTGVTVTLDTDPAVFGLILSSSGAKIYGDAQARTISVADSFQWSDGEIGTNASVTVLNNGTIDGLVEMRQGALRVEGTLNQTNGGQITAISSTSNRVTVGSTGTYNLQQHNNVFIGDTAGAMVIEAGGRFSKNSNTGISYVNWPFTNAGTLEVQTGTLALRDSGEFSGTQNISNGATLHLELGDYTIGDRSPFTGAGTLHLERPVSRGSGTNDFDVFLEFDAPATLNGGGVININSNINLSGGDFEGTATVNLNADANLTVRMDMQANVLNVYKTVTHTSSQVGSDSGFSPVINVHSNGVWNMPDNGILFAGDDNDQVNILPGGTLRKTVNSGTATIDWRFTNQGFVDVQIGRLSLNEGGHLGGTYNVANNAILALDSGNYSIADGVSIQGDGTFDINKPLDIGAGTIPANTVVTFDSGGFLNGSGIYNANSNIVLNGGDLRDTVALNINETATLSGTTSLEDNVITVRGTLVRTSSSIVSEANHNPRINIPDNGVLEIQGTGNFVSGDSSDVIHNQPGGTIRRTVTAGTLGIDWHFTNQGFLDIQIGRLTLTEGAHLEGTYNIAQGASLGLDGRNFTIGDGISIQGAGTLDLNQPLNLGSGTIPANTVVNFNSGGILQGSGIYNVNSNFTFNGGDLSGTVTVNLNHAATLSGTTTLESNEINIRQGLAQTSASFNSTANHNPVINILSNSTYDIRRDGVVLSGDSGDTLINHAGSTIRRSVGSGTATIDWRLTNFGSIDVQIGRLSLTEGARLEGTYNVADGAIFSLDGGSYSIGNGISIQGEGNLLLNRPLDLGSGTIPADTTVTFNSGGILLGSGTYNVNSNINLTGGDLQDTVTFNLNHTVTLNGTTSLENNVVNIHSNLTQVSGEFTSIANHNPIVNVLSNSVYEIQDTGTIISGDSGDRFINHPGGTIRKTVNTGTSTIDWGFTNLGFLDVQVGILALNEGARLEGTYNIANGANLTLGGGSFTIADGISIQGDGSLTIHRPLDIGSGTIPGNTVVSFPSGGLLQGSGIYNANSNFVFTGGDLRDTVTLNLRNTATLNGTMSLENNVVNVHSNLTQTSSSFTSLANHNPVLNILNNSVYEIQTTGTITSGDSGDKLINHAGGTIRKTVNTGTATIDWGLTNLGFLDVQVGMLSLTEGARFEGTYNIANNATLSLDGGFFTIADGISIQGDGLLDINRTLDIGSGTIPANTRVDFSSGGLLVGSGIYNANSNFVFAGGDLRDTVSLNVNGTANVTGSTTLEGNTININSTVSHSSGAFSVLTGFNPTMNLLNGGILNLQNGGTAFFGDANDTVAIASGGSLVKSGNTATTFVSWGVTNAGTIDVQTGILSLTRGLTQTGGEMVLNGGDLQVGVNLAFQGGVLRGHGTLDLSGDNLNNAGGTVKPGASPGTINISGDYTQGAGGTLEIEIDSSPTLTNDLLAVSGSVALDGNLNVILLNGTQPSSSDVFTIVTAGNTLSGRFANAPTTVSLNDGGTFDVVYEAHTVKLQNYTPLNVVTNAGGSHNWSSVSGWIPQTLPSSTIGAVIANPGAINLDVSPSIPAFTLANSSATISGNNTITGHFNWSAGTLSSGIKIVATGGDISGGGVIVDSITVTGSLLQSGGSITSHGSFNPAIRVQTNGTYNIRADGTVVTGDGGDQFIVEPGGTLKRSSSTGRANVDWFINNSGAIVVESGELAFVEGGSIGGASTIASNAVLHLDVGTYNLLAGGQVSGIGEFKTTTDLNLPSGTFTVNSPVLLGTNTTLNGSGGTLALAGGGTIGEGLHLVTGVADVRSQVFHTNGAVHSHGSFNPRFVISSGGVLEYPDETGFFSGDSGDFITNQVGGIIRKSGGTGTSLIDWAVHSDGRVDVQTGTLRFNEGGSIGGSVTLATNTSLLLDGGNFNMLGNGQSTGPGTLIISARADVPSGSVYDARSLVQLTSGGELGGGSGIFAVNDQFNINGGQVNNGGSLNLNGSGTVTGGALLVGTINVNGTVSHSAGQHTSHGSFNPIINIRTNGIYSIDMDGTAIAGDSSDQIVIHSGGTLRRALATGNGAVDWFVNNQGTIEVLTGSLSLIDSGSIAGTSTVSAGAELHLDAGTFNLLDGGQVGGAGQFKTTTPIILPSGTFVLNNPAVITTNTTLGGSGKLALAGGGTVGAGINISTGIIDVRSHVHHTNGAVVAHGSFNPRFLISSGGILDYPDESGSFSGNNGDFITNQVGGIIRKSGGTGTNLIDWAVHSVGTVDVQTGALNFNEGGSIGGAVTLATNTVLLLDNGDFNMLDGGTSTGLGTLVVSATANVPAGSTYDSRAPLRLVTSGGLGGGSGVFAANGPFVIAGGQVNNGGSLDLNGSGSVTGGALLVGTINVNGTVSHTTGQHVSHGSFNPRINIRSNGVYSVDMDGTAITGDSSDIITIDAGGTLRRSGTSGEAIVDWFIANQGAIDVRNGTLSFVDSGSIAGTSTISAGAVWHLDSGTFTLENGGTVGGEGEFKTSTAINLASGEFVANCPAVLTSGTILGGSGFFGMNGGGTVGDGLLMTTGIVDVRSRVFHTNGAVTAHGSHNPRFIISAGGVLDYPDESGSFSGNNGDFITNQVGGFIRKSAGSGTNTIDWAIHNAGNIQVENGALLFNEGGNLGGGVIVASGTKVILRNGTFTGIAGGASTGDGSLIVSTTTDVAAGATYDARSKIELVDGGGLGGGAGVFAVNDTFDIRGGQVNTGGSLDLNGPGTVSDGALFLGTMNVGGTVYHTNGVHVSHGSFNPRVNIRSNGVYRVHTDGLFFNGNNGDVFNINAGGTLLKAEGAGTSTVNWTVQNSGLIECASGELNISQTMGTTAGSFRALGGSLRFRGDLILAGGRLEGNNTVGFDDASRTLSNEGTVSPGASPGTLTIAANYQQGSVGRLEIEIGGTTAGSQHDSLQVNGNASLGGSLNVTNINSFVPQPTDVFTILTASGSLDGTFDNTPGNILTLSNGDRFTVEYTSNEVRLKNFVSASVPPAVTRQPASRVAHVGDNTSFSVEATGTNPLFYQWFRNGSAIVDATNATLNLPSVTTGNAGSYGVSVTNAIGATASDAAQLIVLPSQANAPAIGFGATIGSPASDSANAVFIDNAGNYYFAGGFGGTMILDDQPFVSVTSTGAQDAVVVKFNSNGDVAWARTAGGSDEDEALDVAVDATGHVYVVGEFESATASFGTTPLTTTGSNDVFVAKYSPIGNLLWVRKAGGTGDDTAEGITLTDNAVFVTGSFQSPNATFGTNNIANSGGEDGFLARYSTNGAAIWARSVGGSGIDQLSDIATDASGQLYVVGRFNSTNLANGELPLANAGSNDVLVARYDAAGNRAWLLGLGGSGNDSGFGIAVNNAGLVGIGGEFDSTNFVFSTNDTLTTIGALDGFVGGIGTNGIPQGALQIGGTGADGVHSVATDGAGRFIVAGYSGSPTASFGSLQIGTFSPRNAFAAKLDGSGNPEWIRSLGGTGADEGIDIATGRGLDILMTGETTSPTLLIDGETYTNRGGVDIFLAGLTNNAFFLADHPQGVVTNSESTVTFSVTAVSHQPITYQWRHNGAHLSGQTSSTLSLSGVTVNQSGAYDVIVTSGGSSFLSAPAQLRVDEQVRFSAVNFPQGIASFADVVIARNTGTFGPTSEFNVSTNVLGFANNAAPETQYLSLGRGGSVTIQFVDNILTGSGDSNLDLWIFEIGSAVERTLVEVSSNGVDYVSVGSVTGQPSGIDIDAFGFGINSQLRFVRVTDDPTHGPHTGDTPGADIDAIAAITSVPPDPLITTHPTNAVATAGSNTGFNVAAAGTGPLSYQWFHNSNAIPSGTNAVLQIPGVSPSEAGNYHVVVSNSLDTATSATVTLTVNVPPSITTQPSGRFAILGNATGFSVTAEGTAPLHYQWRKDGTPIANSTNASFTINNVSTADAADYSVVVTNVAGTVVSSNATLSVLVPPQILQQPVDQVVAAGANVTFSISAGGTTPLFYSWRHNGIPLSGETNATLVISSASFSDAGTYQAVITNPAGSITSSGAELRVVQFPIISEQPQSRTAREGASVIFNVTASAATTYQWRRNGTPLPGATTNQLTLHRVGTNNAGTYDVIVGNATTNTLSSTAILAVAGSSVVSTVGKWPDTVRGDVFDTFYTNGYVYTASGAAGLKIYAITNGNALIAHSAIDTDGSARSVFVLNRRAFVADGEKGLKIFDVSDSFHPQLIAAIDTPVFARDVFVSGNHAYVADLDTGLLILDVGDPSRPVQLARHDTPGRAEGVWVAGQYAYVADMSSGLQVLNISNPAAPTAIGTLDTAGHARAVEVVGTIAYLADWDGGLRLVDVSTPSAPTQISQTAVGLAYDLKVIGATVHVAAYDSGLRVVDAGNTNAPSVTGTMNTPGLALGVDAVGNMAFVADWTGGLRLIDVSSSTNPTALAGAVAQGSAWDVRIANDHAYIADFDAGLQIVNISDLTSPSRVGQLDTSGTAVGIHVEGTTSYVADYDRGLLVVDVSNPAAPVQRGNYDTPGYARAVQVQGNHAYVADDIAGLQVIDISTPTAPDRVGGIDTLGTAYGLQISGNRLFVADFERGLQIYSITNPTAPVRIGGIDTTGQAWDVQLIGNFALIADGSAGLKAFNVSDPTNPTLVGSTTTSGTAVDLDVNGSIVAVADWAGGVRFYDLTDPSSPTLLDSFADDSSAAGVHIVNNYAYVASRNHGLSILNTPGRGGFTPLLTTRPQAQTVTEGGTAVFVAGAVGSPSLSYQWQRAGTDIAGATNRGLIITNVAEAHAGNYQVIVTNIFGRVISEAASLTVNRFQEDSATSATSAPTVVFHLRSSRMVNGVMVLEFGATSTQSLSSTPGYRVQSSADLLNWNTLPDIPRTANGLLRVSDPDAATENSSRFYRVIRQ